MKTALAHKIVYDMIFNMEGESFIEQAEKALKERYREVAEDAIWSGSTPKIKTHEFKIPHKPVLIDVSKLDVLLFYNQYQKLTNSTQLDIDKIQFYEILKQCIVEDGE